MDISTTEPSLGYHPNTNQSLITPPIENITQEMSEWVDGLHNFQDKLDMFVPPILILFGFSGNIFSVVIMRSKHFRQCPCSVLLCFLALVDTGVLITGLLRIWVLSTFLLDIRTLCKACCKIHYFVTYMLQHLSSWTVVMVTVERFVSVFYPFEAKIVCSHRRLTYGMAAVVTILIMINGHVFFTLNIHKHHFYDTEAKNYTYDLNCGFVDDGTNYFGFYIWPWIDYAILAFLPLCFLAIGNTLIAYRVFRSKTQYCSEHLSRQFSCQYSGQKKRVASMTLMLFAVTITFFLTTTPIEVYLIGYGHWDDTPPVASVKTLTAYVVCSLWFYVNNASNFLLYCVGGSRFRKALQSFFKRKIMHVQRVGSAMDNRPSTRTSMYC